jgi:hypothetical protein
MLSKIASLALQMHEDLTGLGCSSILPISWINATSAAATYDKLHKGYLKVLMNCHGSSISDTQDCTKPSGARTQMNILSNIIHAVLSVCFKRIALQSEECKIKSN